jgi:hypothetical protein
MVVLAATVTLRKTGDASLTLSVSLFHGQNDPYRKRTVAKEAEILSYDITLFGNVQSRMSLTSL